MIFQVYDLLRLIIIYIVQLTVGGILFIVIAILILRRSKKMLNIILSMFFFSIALSIFFNLIYAALRVALIVKILHLITTFFFFWAMVFLLLFNLVLLKSAKYMNRTKNMLIIALWSLVLFGLVVIGFFGGVSIDKTTNWKPVWNRFFYIYAITAMFFLMFVPTILYSYEIYRDFKSEELKRRWKFFIVGTFFYYFITAGISTVNLLADDLIRTLWGFVLLACFSAFYVLYYGVAKQLD